MRNYVKLGVLMGNYVNLCDINIILTLLLVYTEKYFALNKKYRPSPARSMRLFSAKYFSVGPIKELILYLLTVMYLTSIIGKAASHNAFIILHTRSLS